MAVQDTTTTLQEIVPRLREALSPSAIYLFGSRARGTNDPGSDIDLLIVVEEDARSPYERDAAAYLALADVNAPVDVLVYTRAEFERRAELPVSFERTVRAKGKLIHAA